MVGQTWNVESSVGDVDEMRSPLSRCVDHVLTERCRVHRERNLVAARTNNRQLQLRLAGLMSYNCTDVRVYISQSV